MTTKPCPFCASDNISAYKLECGYQVECVNCNASTKAMDTKKLAIDEWNRRSSDSPEKSLLTFEFDSPVVREHFAMWLCNCAEQDYWQYMEYREQEYDGNITAVSFDYHGTDRKNPMFLADNIVRTVSGRTTEENDD